MSFAQLQKFNIFPHYVEDHRHPSKVVQSMPYMLTYAFVVAMVILIITEITLSFQTSEFKTEVESIADTDDPFYLDLICDDQDGCMLDLLKKDHYPEECAEEFPMTMAYDEAREVRLCRIAGETLFVIPHLMSHRPWSCSVNSNTRNAEHCSGRCRGAK